MKYIYLRLWLRFCKKNKKMIPYKGIIFYFHIMYLLGQIKKQFFSQIMLHQASPEAWGEQITTLEQASSGLSEFEATAQIATRELDLYLGRIDELLDAREDEWDDAEIQRIRDRIESLREVIAEAEEGMQVDHIIRRWIHEVRTEIEESEGEEIQDENFEDADWFAQLDEAMQVEYRELIASRNSERAAYEAAINELSQEQRDMFGNGEEVLEYSETRLDETASFEDRVDMVRRDIERIQTHRETLRLQILLLEDPENVSARHELLDGVFDTLPEESREGLIWNSIESLTAGDIYSMKQRGVDLATIFMVTQNGELSLGKDHMDSGDMLKVNFGPSSAADRIIGAGDVLAIEDIYSVEINGISGTRRFSPRPGYYSENGRYLAIHDGYQVRIGEKRAVTPSELSELTTAREERFSEMRREDIHTVISGLEGDNPEIPFSVEADIALLNTILAETEIEGLRYDSETWTIQMPEGMVFGDVREIMNEYAGVIGEITTYISENRDAVRAHSDGESLVLEWINYSPLLIERAIASMSGSSLSDQVSFDADSMTLRTSGDLRIEDIIGGDYEYAGNGTRHLRYMSEIRAAASSEGVPIGAIIQLIYHENRNWDPTISPPSSSAYGLGQMIDSTWGTYGRGLNRNNPGDQLLATARYMAAIKERKNCPWEHVLAYYNTGEGINSVSLERARYFARINPAITRQIPGGIWAINSPRVYFTGAVAYYNDMSYAQARATL